MKRIFILVFILASSISVMKAQNNVGIGTIAPNASALLDLSATDKGFLIPRTDTTTLNNSGNAIADGLLIFQTADKTFYFYDVSFPKWRSIGTAFIAGTGITINGNVINAVNDNDWLFNGNNIYNGNSGNVGVGTSSPLVSFQVGTTDAIGIPSGNTAQRPSAAPTGATRFNSDLGVLEYYNGTSWLNVNTPPIGATYIQWFEASSPSTIYPNTTWVETDIIDGSFIRARGGFANVSNGAPLTGVTQSGAIIDHQHTASATVGGSGTLSTSANGAHNHNWGGWWSTDDSREWINGNGDGVNGNTISDNSFWWGGNPATVGSYSQGDYSNLGFIIDAAGNHNHGGFSGGYNDIGTGCGNPKYVPYDDNNQSSTVSETNNTPNSSCPWNSEGVVGNFLGRLNAELNHNHAINTDGNHGHNARLYAHRHWLKERPTSFTSDHTHIIADHTHTININVGSLISGASPETRPVNEAVIFWRRTN